jgi:hypothetical protein
MWQSFADDSVLLHYQERSTLMTPSISIEWVEFQLRSGTSESEFLAVSHAFQTDFLDLQPGYRQRTLVRLNDHGLYADLVHWSDAADMRAAMAASKVFPVCGAYFALLKVVESPSLGTAIAKYENAAYLDTTAATVESVGGLEFSLFQPKPGVSDDMLKQAAKRVADSLYCGQPGYLSHLVVKSAQGVYADVVLASSGKRAAELCGLWGSGPYAEPCLPYLEMIRPESMQIAFFDSLK